MTETMPTSEVLNRAADLIEERGWATGTIGMLAAAGAALCLEGALGAVQKVRLHDGWDGWGYSYCAVSCTPAYLVVAEYLGIRPQQGGKVYSWNDRDGRTASEVIEVLRACAVIEASRERESVSA